MGLRLVGSRSPMGLVPVMSIEEWRDSAACKGHSELFLSGDEDKTREQNGRKSRTYAEAQKADFHKMKKICDSCPVRIPCLNYAMSNNIQFLVWGGLGANARAKIRRTQVSRTTRIQPRRSSSSGEFLPSLAPNQEAMER